MENDKNKKKVTEATEAEKTLAPDSRPGDSRSKMMADVVVGMGQMSNDNLLQFFDQVMAQFQNGGAAAAAPDAAAQNSASIAAKGAIKEDIDAIFGGDEALTEEFKEKVSTLFEAALETRIQLEKADLEEAYETKLTEQIEEISEKLNKDVGEWLDYLGAQWLKENKVAVERTITTELAESFVSELGSLCRKFNFNLPESDIPVIEELTNKIEVLEKKINESESLNVQLHEAASKLERDLVINEASVGLTIVQADQMKKLVETIDPDSDLDSFKRKISIIKENYIINKSKPSTDTKLINEEIDPINENENKPDFVDPIVAASYELIQRTAKRN